MTHGLPEWDNMLYLVSMVKSNFLILLIAHFMATYLFNYMLYKDLNIEKRVASNLQK